MLPKDRVQPVVAAEEAHLVRRPVSADMQVRFEGETWAYVVDQAEKKLQRLREKNDDARLNEVQTAVLRGRIRELRDLLALPERLKAERMAALAQRDAPSEDD